MKKQLLEENLQKVGILNNFFFLKCVLLWRNLTIGFLHRFFFCAVYFFVCENSYFRSCSVGRGRKKSEKDMVVIEKEEGVDLPIFIFEIGFAKRTYTLAWCLSPTCLSTQSSFTCHTVNIDSSPQNNSGYLPLASFCIYIGRSFVYANCVWSLTVINELHSPFATK